MRLTILCEGDTEKRVLKKFLEPYCSNFDRVEVIKPGLGGSGRLKQEYKGLAETELETNRDSIVFCLIDLLNAPFSYPKVVEQAPDPTVARYSYVKQYMEGKIDPAVRDRFHAFPVVREIETWLLADVSALNEFFRTREIKERSHPENVLHPAEELKRMMNRFRSEDYVKVKHGSQLFEKVSAERIYADNCPHFEVIINQLLELQGISGNKSSEVVYEPPNHALYLRLASLQDEFDAIWEGQEEMSETAMNRLIEIEAEMESFNRQIIDGL